MSLLLALAGSAGSITGTQNVTLGNLTNSGSGAVYVSGTQASTLQSLTQSAIAAVAITGESTGSTISSPNKAASWTVSNATFTENAIANPITGALDGFLLQENGANSSHQLTRTNGVFSGITTGDVIAVDGYFKYAGRYQVIGFSSASTATSSLTKMAAFDLQSGVITNLSSGVTAGIDAVGASGWYYCWVKTTATASGGAQTVIRLDDDGSIGSLTYTGNGSSGNYVYNPRARIVPVELTQTGSAGVSISGTQAVTLDNLASNASGSVTVVGNEDGQLPGVGQTASATVQISATQDVTLGGITQTAEGFVIASEELRYYGGKKLRLEDVQVHWDLLEQRLRTPHHSEKKHQQEHAPTKPDADPVEDVDDFVPQPFTHDVDAAIYAAIRKQEAITAMRANGIPDDGIDLNDQQEVETLLLILAEV